MIKKIEFRACISPIMSGIRVGSDMMRVQFDIPKSDIQDAVPLLALTDSALRVTVEVDTSPVSTRIQRPVDGGDVTAKPKKKEKAAKGAYGRYWQAMFKHGALNHPELPHALQIDEGQPVDFIKEQLRAAFDVTSLTFISPDSFEDWCQSNGISSLVTISRNAAIEAQQ